MGLCYPKSICLSSSEIQEEYAIPDAFLEKSSSRKEASFNSSDNKTSNTTAATSGMSNSSKKAKCSLPRTSIDYTEDSGPRCLHLNSPPQLDCVHLESDDEDYQVERDSTPSNDLALAAELYSAPFQTRQIACQSSSCLEWNEGTKFMEEIEGAENLNEICSVKFKEAPVQTGENFQDAGVNCERCGKITGIQERAIPSCGHVFHIVCIEDSKLCSVCGNLVESALY